MSRAQLRVKICGITNLADAKAAYQAGAHALGFIFTSASGRAISVEQACFIKANLPPFVNIVALFVNASWQQVASVDEQLQPGYLQFHGQESESFCAQFAKPYIKSVPVKTSADVERAAVNYASACGLLLDVSLPGVYGGTGQKFDWRQIPRTCSRPLIVAGGLTPTNVVDLPDHESIVAVDVSSGVEQQTGLKSAVKMNNFCQAVRNICD